MASANYEKMVLVLMLSRQFFLRKSSHVLYPWAYQVVKLINGYFTTVLQHDGATPNSKAK